jgi:hypothetical protein
MRLQRHGTVEAGRPDWYGSKTKHPLYITWNSAKRAGSLCDRWGDDFWRFVEDVSPVPAGNSRLFRKDKSLPYSKENCEWRQIEVTRTAYPDKSAYREAEKDRNNRRSREKHDPVKFRETRLKNLYGLTVEQYEEMLSRQAGVCAICKQPETRAAIGGKGVKPLSVDHCHGSRKVRGLLCSHCNTALGLLNDDIGLFEACIDYLKRYRE